MNYTAMSVTDQFAVVTTEVGRHLPRVMEAAQMWRDAAEQLAEVSESLGRELESVAPYWQDATGNGLLARGRERKEAVDNALTRITTYQPWHALDDLARQLLLTEARMAGAAERSMLTAMCARAGLCEPAGCACAAGSAPGGGEDTGAHLAELDRYFRAAADAVLHTAGLESLLDGASDPLGDGTGLSPTAGPGLAGGPGFDFSSGAPGAGGGGLPPGAVTLPGLVAVPPSAGTLSGGPGSGLGGRSRDRGLGPAGPFDSSRPPSSAAGAGGGPGERGMPPGGGVGGPDSADLGPQQMERVFEPPEDTGPTPAPETPAAPDRGDASTAGSGSGGGLGGMAFPPMMFPPMMGMGAGGPNSRMNTGARTVGGNDRPSKARANPTPGVPARLRGRSGLADPATNGFRSPTVAGKNADLTGQTPAEPLEHEMWEVNEPSSASPLKPEAADQGTSGRRGRRAL